MIRPQQIPRIAWRKLTKKEQELMIKFLENNSLQDFINKYGKAS